MDGHHHPPPPCEPASFWMQLEARIGLIELNLEGGLTPMEVHRAVEDALVLKRRLRAARLKLASALGAAEQPHPL